MSPSPQGYRQPWEEPSPEREVFDEMLRRPYEELHAENQQLRDQLQAALTQINALLERERRREAEADEDVT